MTAHRSITIHGCAAAALTLSRTDAVKDEGSVKTAKTASVTTEICHGFVLLCTPEGEGDTHRLYVRMTLALQRLLHDLTVSLQGCAGQDRGACVTRCCCRAAHVLCCVAVDLRASCTADAST